MMTLRELVESKCVHFNGVRNSACKAGVVYATVEGEVPPYCAGLPCFKDSRSVGKCEKCTWPTEEQVQARLDHIEASTKRTSLAREAIVAYLEKEKAPRGCTGVIACPNCGKSLNFARSASNGHIHAKCETEGCASWME